MLSGQTGILHSLPEWQGVDGTASGGGCYFLGVGGCLMGVGTTGSVTGHESGDEGHDEGGESHKEVVSLIAWSHTQIYHEFGLGGKFIYLNISQKKDVCSTTKYVQVVDLRLLAMKRFVWCAPLKVGQGCPIVDMDGMGSSEFPPAIGQACHMVHSLSFVHQSAHKSFCTSILLKYMGGRVVDSNALPLEQIVICSRFVFSIKV